MRTSAVRVQVVLVFALALVTGCTRASDEAPYVPPTMEKLPDQVLSLVVVGDYGTGSDDELAVASAARSWVSDNGADAFVSTGDNVYPEAEPEYFDPAWTRPYGWVQERDLEVIVALGNHDLEDESPDNVIDFFGLPAQWYRRSVGNADVFVLDSNHVESAAQTEWFEKSLGASDARWKIVVVHKPPFACGRYDGIPAERARWVPLFRSHGVDLVLSGHDHNYQRFASTDGVVHLITGGGGDALYGLDDECIPETPAREAANDSLNHFVTIRGSEKELNITAIAADGTVIDRHSVRGGRS